MKSSEKNGDSLQRMSHLYREFQDLKARSARLAVIAEEDIWMVQRNMTAARRYLSRLDEYFESRRHLLYDSACPGSESADEPTTRERPSSSGRREKRARHETDEKKDPLRSSSGTPVKKRISSASSSYVPDEQHENIPLARFHAFNEPASVASLVQQRTPDSTVRSRASPRIRTPTVDLKRISDAKLLRASKTASSRASAPSPSRSPAASSSKKSTPKLVSNMQVQPSKINLRKSCKANLQPIMLPQRGRKDSKRTIPENPEKKAERLRGNKSWVDKHGMLHMHRYVHGKSRKFVSRTHPEAVKFECCIPVSARTVQKYQKRVQEYLRQSASHATFDAAAPIDEQPLSSEAARQPAAVSDRMLREAEQADVPDYVLPSDEEETEDRPVKDDLVNPPTRRKASQRIDSNDNSDHARRDSPTPIQERSESDNDEFEHQNPDRAPSFKDPIIKDVMAELADVDIEALLQTPPSENPERTDQAPVVAERQAPAETVEPTPVTTTKLTDIVAPVSPADLSSLPSRTRSPSPESEWEKVYKQHLRRELRLSDNPVSIVTLHSDGEEEEETPDGVRIKLEPTSDHMTLALRNVHHMSVSQLAQFCAILGVTPASLSQSIGDRTAPDASMA